MKVLFVVFISILIQISFVSAFFSHQQHGSLKSLRILSVDPSNTDGNYERKELWKRISNLERQAVELLSLGDSNKNEEAFKLLSQSAKLKNQDPFLQLTEAYNVAVENKNQMECDRILAAMKNSGLPPHISELAKKRNTSSLVNKQSTLSRLDEPEVVDPGSTFSDTVTEKVRVKVSSFFDNEKSSPADGKYMFYYKVAIYNEGPEPVQVVGRMWEIEKCLGEKEVIRGPGIMNTQPIIPAGDVFTYQSSCPLKIFPPAGKRILASMSGAYTMCKGNMGQHNFSAKISKFNLILPETVVRTK